MLVMPEPLQAWRRPGRVAPYRVSHRKRCRQSRRISGRQHRCLAVAGPLFDVGLERRCVDAFLGEECFGSDGDRNAAHTALGAATRHGDEVGDINRTRQIGGQRPDDGIRERVLGESLDRGHALQSGLSVTSSAMSMSTPVASLRSTFRSCRSRLCRRRKPFQRLAAFNQDAFCRAAPARHHHRGWDGKAHRARARDDQDRDGGGQRPDERRLVGQIHQTRNVSSAIAITVGTKTEEMRSASR